MSTDSDVRAPTESLPDPAPRARRRVGGLPMASLRVRLMTTTPVLGGSSAPRELDDLDPIRAPSIRGHLRFWWRALHGHACVTSAELAARERHLWGGVGGDAGTRSLVEIQVEVDLTTLSRDTQDIPQKAPGAYALWVASKQKTPGQEKPPAPRWRPSLRFMLQVTAPVDHLSEVKSAIRAWILWGGYGSRTRRGLGSLTVVEEAVDWLPSQPTREEWSRLFPGLPLFGVSSREDARPVPLLRGARLLYGTPRSREDAWVEALGWLREFRQGEGRLPPGARRELPSKGAFAREQGSERPGRSLWPEADQIRQLLTKSDGTAWAHAPRPQYIGKALVWPRAGFGLPLAIRFQRSARRRQGEQKGAPYPAGEPPDVELHWHDGQRLHERLASPLIVKAMPLANGSFVPIALWLRRAWPASGRVVLMKKRVQVRGSEAIFDQFRDLKDITLYDPLRKSSLEEAFLDWVKGFQGVKEST